MIGMEPRKMSTKKMENGPSMSIKAVFMLWVPVRLISKKFYGWTRNLGSIPANIKNQLAFWYDDKELLLKVNVIDWNS